MLLRKRQKLDWETIKFDVDDATKLAPNGECKECDCKKGLTTSWNVKKHYGRHHEAILQEYVDKRNEEAPSQVRSMDTYFMRSTPRDSFLMYAATTSFPRHHVRNEDLKVRFRTFHIYFQFQKFFDAMNLKPPTEYEIGQFVDAKIAKIQEVVTNAIADKFYALAVDVATTRAMQLSVLGGAVYYIDFESKSLRVAALDLFQLSGKHDADNIRRSIESMISNFGLDTSKIVRTVSDGAANMRKALL